MKKVVDESHLLGYRLNMMNKATHSGSCQVCGRNQKLPGGKLSKHGYTVRWSFFEGVCWGADHLPFEQDISLIEGAIKQATAQAEEAEKASAEWKAGKQLPGNKAWKCVYVGPKFRGDGGYYWMEVTVRETEGPFTYQPDGGKEERLTIYPGEFNPKDGESKLDAVRRSMNIRYAERFLDKRAADLRSYVAWQKARIKDWKPQPLVPVGAEVAAVTERKAARAAKSDHKRQIEEAKRAYEKELRIKNNIMLEMPRGERDSEAWQELYYASPVTKFAAGLRKKLDAVKAENAALAGKLLPHINAAIAQAELAENLKNSSK